MRRPRRFTAIALSLLGTAACSADTGSLGLVPERDAGAVIDSGAGESPDAGTQIERDAGVEELTGCRLGWVDIASIAGDAIGPQLRGFSFAAQPDGFAATWEVGGTRTKIGFFDPNGAIRLELEVGSRSRVIAYDRGFLRGGTDGLERYDVMGNSLERGSNPFIPMKVTGGRLWGLNTDGYISTSQLGPLESVGPFAVGISGDYRTIGFGPDRFVVVEDAPTFDVPAVLHTYRLGVRGAEEIASFPLPREEIGGEFHHGHALAAAEWNDAEARFDLLVGMRLGPTRQFGARLMHLDEDGLRDGTPLYDEPTSVAYESMTGAIAIGSSGALAVGYRSPYNASTLNLDVVHRTVQHVDIRSGASYPTPALIQAVGDRFAILYGSGASGTNQFESVLQLRCDIPQ